MLPLGFRIEREVQGNGFRADLAAMDKATGNIVALRKSSTRASHQSKRYWLKKSWSLHIISIYRALCLGQKTFLGLFLGCGVESRPWRESIESPR